MMSSKVRAARAEQPPALMMSLPYDLIVDIVARVPRCNYPIVSLVSKSFQSLVASSHLYTRRSLSGCTEHCLYVVLYNKETCERHLCILRRKVNSNRLVIIRSLPYEQNFGAYEYVAVGSKIYAVGGSPSPDTLSIDCKSHTVQPLPGIPQLQDRKVADIIDGKIYVITRNGVMVFDTETQLWDPVMKKPDVELDNMMYGDSVVMDGKIYLRDLSNSFVFEPKESKWELEEILKYEQWDDACVVDDVLYYYDDCCKELRAYDPEQRCFRVVKGIEEVLSTAGLYWPEPHSYGGKLALLFYKDSDPKGTSEIWCAEIALETRQGGELWGKVQWCDVVFGPFGDRLFYLNTCLAVTV